MTKIRLDKRWLLPVKLGQKKSFASYCKTPMILFASKLCTDLLKNIMCLHFISFFGIEISWFIVCCPKEYENMPNLQSQHMYNPCLRHRPIARYVKLRVAHAPEIPGTFSPPPRVTDPDMQHGCVTHVPWCMPGSLTSGFLWSRWRGKRSQHSRRTHNPQFHLSGKTSMAT